ncbi:hypothetical protein MG7_03799 [Candida albicans P34048]|nr:hypothetical protein MG7_03799 [Candida albicans P34048]
MKFFQLITFLLTFALIEASGRKPRKYSKLDTAMQACNVYIGKYGTVCASSGKKKSINWKCYCNQDPGFGTISDCLVRGYNNDTSIIDKFVDKCNMTESKFYEKYDRIQKEFKTNGTHYANKTSKTKTSSASKTSSTKASGTASVSSSTGKASSSTQKVSPTPLLINYKTFTPYKNAYAMSYNNYNISIYYGAGLLGYWAGIFVIAILANLFRKMFPRLTNYCTGAVSNAFRKYILLPATFGKKKAQPLSFGFGGFFDGLVPTRLESLIITVFVLLTGFLSALHIHHVKDNPQYATKNAELGHLIADRTGILSAFLIPLLILFGGRNNFLQWLTGWDFATFIMYHRWISRIDVLLIIVHAITFTVSDKATGKYNTRMKRDFMIWGVVATICAGFILFQAMLFFRRRCYEVFFCIHIVLVVFFVVGGFHHLDDQGYGDFMWAAIAVWVFDRAVRLGRIFFFGARKATVSIKGGETLKIEVPKPKYWKSIAGGHAFIQFLRPTVFLQSHPFTFTTTESEDKIVFYAKIKNGITENISKYLSRLPGNTATIRVLVEGPYGEPSGAGRNCKNVVFIAGGNGIPGIYSECVDLAKKSKNQSIKLVWIIRHWKSLSWFTEELEYLKKTNVQTTVYVTQPQDYNGMKSFEQDSNSEKKSDEKDSVESPQNSFVSKIKQDLSHVEFIEGRPNIVEQVEQEIKETDGALGFVTCGHPAMVDELRSAVTKNLNASKHRVEFHEQLQTWA